MDLEDIKQGLELLQGKLQECVDEAAGLAELMDECGYSALTAEMTAYLIPHMETWARNRQQIGSIPSLLATVQEYEEEVGADD